MVNAVEQKDRRYFNLLNFHKRQERLTLNLSITDVKVKCLVILQGIKVENLHSKNRVPAVSLKIK